MHNLIKLLTAPSSTLKKAQITITELPAISLPTGKIVATDPLAFADRNALPRIKVKANKYPLSLISLPKDPRSIAYAVIRFSKKTPVEVKKAGHYPVDAGMGCFMDIATQKHYLKRMNVLEKENSTFNMYEHEIEPLLKQQKNANWLEYLAIPKNRKYNVMLFKSGWGDGVYESYWLLDEQKQPVFLVTDFNLYEDKDFAVFGDAAPATTKSAAQPTKKLTPAEQQAAYFEQAWQTYTEVHDLKRAIDLYAQGIKLDPKAPTAGSATQIVAGLYLKQDQAQEAQKMVKAALTQTPQNTALLTLQTQLNLLLDDPKAAQASYKKIHAILLSPANVRELYTQVLVLSKNHTEALQQLAEVDVLIFNQNYLTLYLLLLLAQKQHGEKDAETIYLSATKSKVLKDKTVVGLLTALYLLGTETAKAKPLLSSMITTTEAELKKHPDDTEAWLRLLIGHSALKQSKKFTVAYEAATKAVPPLSLAHLQVTAQCLKQLL